MPGVFSRSLGTWLHRMNDIAAKPGGARSKSARKRRNDRQRKGGYQLRGRGREEQLSGTGAGGIAQGEDDRQVG
jgi:hypothetical protein